MMPILNSIDLSTVLGVVSTIGIVVVSIALAFKGMWFAMCLINESSSQRDGGGRRNEGYFGADNDVQSGVKW